MQTFRGPARKWLSYSKAAGLLRTMITEGSHDEAVLDLGASIARDCGRDPAMQAQAVWEYVRRTIVYLEDPHDDDHFQAPAVTISRGAGDCDDQAVLLGSLLRAIGFNTRLVFVFKARPKDYTAEFPEHVYLEVDVDKGQAYGPIWVSADTVPFPAPGGELYLARYGNQVPVGFKEYVEVG